MTKKELIDYTAKAAGLSKSKAAEAVGAVFDGVSHGLRNDGAKTGEVNVIGFGKFEKKLREARDGRNPQTGDPVKIAARYAVTFSPGSGLKETVN